ncbi:MAG: hypothetical protein C5B47_02860 [Verrucomicrobia bacterium]|nr:MAG: hypothetical protein C5B47_02860 [Verrucomicrobiota bacterium]
MIGGRFKITQIFWLRSIGISRTAVVTFTPLIDNAFGMNKSLRLEEFIKSLTGSINAKSCYQAYFLCFNEAHYYQAHDVLEYAWLRMPEEKATFFKGLIQFAGAFVHLQKQYLRPHHYKFKGRLRPAKQLFWLAAKNLQPYCPKYLQLQVNSVLVGCECFEGKIMASGYQLNPWRPETAPVFLDHNGLRSLRL